MEIGGWIDGYMDKWMDGYLTSGNKLKIFRLSAFIEYIST